MAAAAFRPLPSERGCRHASVLMRGEFVILRKNRDRAVDMFSVASAMFEWKDDYLVGVTAIDQQHKQLFRVAGRFHDAVVANKGKAMVDRLLGSLVRYTMGHYRVEERLMEAIHYPEREQHMAQHRALLGQLLAFQERFAGGETVTIQVLQFLSLWLVGHTSSRDRQLGEYYRMKKESQATADGLWRIEGARAVPAHSGRSRTSR